MSVRVGQGQSPIKASGARVTEVSEVERIDHGDLFGVRRGLAARGSAGCRPAETGDSSVLAGEEKNFVEVERKIHSSTSRGGGRIGGCIREGLSDQENSSLASRRVDLLEGPRAKGDGGNASLRAGLNEGAGIETHVECWLEERK